MTGIFFALSCSARLRRGCVRLRRGTAQKPNLLLITIKCDFHSAVGPVKYNEFKGIYVISNWAVMNDNQIEEFPI